MSRLRPSFVLGYHGCDAAIVDELLKGKTSLIHSEREYDWLGPGAYFWESDPQRAREWAEERASRKKGMKAAVIGAVIDLRNCLDLTVRENIELVQGAHESFVKEQQAADLELPANLSPKGTRKKDRLLRYLDCAVIKHLHSTMDNAPPGMGIEPFDTVRGMFVEGEPIYEGCGFNLNTHTQIAVRNDACIIGIFVPRAI